MDEFTSLFALERTDEIAKGLLGVELLYQTKDGLVGGYIVEVEAYLGKNDPDSTAYKGEKNRDNWLLYEASSTIYMYKMFGLVMLNVVTQGVGEPEEIAIRAIEPSRGLEILNTNRPKTGPNQTNGPGKLSQALGIKTYKLNGKCFNQCALQFEFEHRLNPKKILTLARRGSDESQSWERRGHRFAVAGNPFVSTISNGEVDQENRGWK